VEDVLRPLTTYPVSAVCRGRTRNLAVPDGGNIRLWSVSPAVLDPTIGLYVKESAQLAKPEEFRRELETLSQHVEALRKTIDSLC
jgi:hypothetical protein